MISVKCDCCGAEMCIWSSGELYCPYCGAKKSFSDKELSDYKAFRKRMLEYLASCADQKQDEESSRWLWQRAESVSFTTDTNRKLEVSYLFSSQEDGVTMYVARKNVIFYFPKQRAYLASKMLEKIQSVSVPQAGDKDLWRTLPSFVGKYALCDGGVCVAVSKPENMYPLSAFGNLPYVHVAWIVSRLENIACLLTYNGTVHQGLSVESIFLNPITHEAALLGNWWRASEMTEKTAKTDLLLLRDVAKKALGTNDAPKGFLDFLKKKPETDAFEDFKEWDRVIEEKLGGRVFHKMGLDAIQ